MRANPLRSPWDPGRRPRLALAPRGSWARHAHAADTATRAGPAGGGRGTEGRRASARPCARLRPLKGGARLTQAPLGLLLPLTTAAALPRPRAAQRRPYPGVPARLRRRGTSFAPLLGGRRKSPRATASAHACSVAGLYNRDAA